MRNYYYYWAVDIKTNEFTNFYSSDVLNIGDYVSRNKATYKIIDWAFA